MFIIEEICSVNYELWLGYDYNMATTTKTIMIIAKTSFKNDLQKVY